MDVSQIIGPAVTMALTGVGGLIAYGRLQAKVEAMKEQIEESQSEIKVMDSKLEAKKLDVLVFQQYSAAQDRLADMNNQQHSQILSKLDMMIGLIVKNSQKEE